jgi:hypothetical protein
VKIPQHHDGSKHAGLSDVGSATGPSAEVSSSHLHFFAVATSHCFEEFWLDDRDGKTEEDETGATIKALQCFRDTLSAQSELNLSIFSKNQRQQNHLEILDGPEIVSQIEKMSEEEQLKEKTDLLLKFKELEETEQKKLPQAYTKDSSLSEMKIEYIQWKIAKDIEHLDAEISKKQSHFSSTIDKLLACLESLPGSKVIQKSFLNLKLLEAFKFFLNSDDLVVKVRVFILFQMIPTRDANVMPYRQPLESTLLFTPRSRSGASTLLGCATWAKNWSVSVIFQPP